MADMTNRYACSLYVDLRLGLIGGRCRNREEAQDETARVYGAGPAQYAREVCN